MPPDECNTIPEERGTLVLPGPVAGVDRIPPDPWPAAEEPIPADPAVWGSPDDKEAMMVCPGRRVWVTEGDIFWVRLTADPNELKSARVWRSEREPPAVWERSAVMDPDKEGANVIEAEIDGATVMESDIESTTFDNPDIEGSTDNESDKEGATVIESDIERSTVMESDIDGTTVIESDIDGATVMGSDIDGATVIESDIEGTTVMESEGSTESEAVSITDPEKDDGVIVALLADDIIAESVTPGDVFRGSDVIDNDAISELLTVEGTGVTDSDCALIPAVALGNDCESLAIVSTDAVTPLADAEFIGRELISEPFTADAVGWTDVPGSRVSGADLETADDGWTVADIGWSVLIAGSDCAVPEADIVGMIEASGTTELAPAATKMAAKTKSWLSPAMFADN